MGNEMAGELATFVEVETKRSRGPSLLPCKHVWLRNEDGKDTPIEELCWPRAEAALNNGYHRLIHTEGHVGMPNTGAATL